MKLCTHNMHTIMPDNYTKINGCSLYDNTVTYACVVFV